MGVSLALLVCAMVLPASAAVYDYNDYVTNVIVDGDSDLVTVVIPFDSSRISLYDYNSGHADHVESINALFTVSEGHSYALDLTLYYPDSISLADIPSGTILTIDADVQLMHGFLDVTTVSEKGFFYFYDSDMDRVGTYSVDVVSTGFFKWSIELPSYDVSYKSFCPGISYDGFVPNEDTTISVSINSVTLEFSISSLLRLQQTTGKTNAILSEVEKQLAENGLTLEEVLQQQEQTNDKLDDLISGGSGADDLIAGGDKIENAGSGLGEDIGKIEDFEDQYMGQLEDNLGDVIAGADLTWLYPPLMFVQRYLNKIVAAIPSKYLIVFTLPMLFGLFMYIVGHPVRAPRPDTSGDQVTRETFTETTILKGPNAGRVSATRTVTTSQEIGRVHNE